MGILWQDVRYGLRMLARSPGYTAVTLLTLTLGIGVTTAIFSTVYGVPLRPLAYPDSNRLVSVQEQIPSLADKYPTLPVSARHFIEWRTRCSSFESLSLIDNGSMTLTGRGEPERLETLQVAANLFETLRVQPALGRTFDAADRSKKVSVISNRLAKMLWPQEATVIGRKFLYGDREEREVIGVVKDVRAGADGEAVSMLYMAYWEGPMDRAVVMAGAVIAAALAACCVPARRAARANPMMMLRQE